MNDTDTTYDIPTAAMRATWAAEAAARPQVEKALAQYQRGILSLVDLQRRLEDIAGLHGL